MGAPAEESAEPKEPPDCAHIWNSTIMRPSRVIDCDWCVRCSAARPGFKDPREKWKHLK